MPKCKKIFGTIQRISYSSNPEQILLSNGSLDYNDLPEIEETRYELTRTNFGGVESSET